MKQLLLAGLLALGTASFAQNSSSATTTQKPEEQIRQYWFVMLTKGPTRTQDSATAMAIQKAHIDNINKLYNEGKIKVAGPFGKNDQGWQGVFIFDCPTREEVERLLQTDKAVASGRLAFTVTPWYTAPIGSFVAGIPEKKY
ncbi:YciI family protein [Paraflavitalea pollutisoli]|uniref:YciI family protein n=1 Tax=Paraflavitalea pollutisoli TaxID=3034143 RepID=UPI0023ECDC7F|nr:YciI family protein [Paraflavitalea sp. H1-2-19X]